MPKQTITETRLYPFLFVEEGAGAYSALCQFGATQGATLDQAYDMAQSLLVDMAPDDGTPLAGPWTADQLRAKYDADFFEGAEAALTLVPYTYSNEAVRLTISLPGDLAAKLEVQGGNKSRFVADALRAALSA